MQSEDIDTVRSIKKGYTYAMDSFCVTGVGLGGIGTIGKRRDESRRNLRCAALLA
jgi:hypothetical protein